MIKILITGDYCPQNATAELLDNKQNQEVFTDLLSVISDCDYSITNLESPLVEGNVKSLQLKSGVKLKCNFNGLKALKEVGFNMVTLANNHFRDFGDKGVVDTINACNDLEIDIVGGGRNIEEAQKILYKKIKDKTFAFANFCENEFSIASESHGGANPVNPVANYYQIKEACNKADYVIVIVHGGHEHYQLPSPRMIELYRFFVDVGANAVISHHTHCFSGSERYRGVPIYYGIGNFLFDSSYAENETFHEGLAIVLEFNENVAESYALPLVQCKEEPKVRKMNKAEYEKFKSKFDRLNEIISQPKLIKESFERKSKESGPEYLSVFEPYSSRLTRGLFFRKLLPSLLKLRKKIMLLGLIQCESHRDILIKELARNIEEYKNEK